MIEKNLSKNPISLIPWSVLIHGLAFLIFSNITPVGDLSKMTLSPPKSAPKKIEITQIKPEKLNEIKRRLRTAGVKNGKGNGILKKNINLKKQTNKLEKLSLDPKKSIVNKKVKAQINQVDLKPTAKDFKKGSASRFTYRAKRKDLNALTADHLDKISKAAKNQAGILSNSNLSISFDPPPGVKFSELNKLEQIFYGFNLRIYNSYVNSLITSHLNYVNANPTAKFQNVRRETLRAVLRFDKNGNVERIKVLRWSQNDDIQNVFQNTLEGIRAIPNPPKAFLSSRDHFDLYFSLVIQG